MMRNVFIQAAVSLSSLFTFLEFPQIFISIVYIHPNTNLNKASDAPKVFLDDFKNCPATKNLYTPIHSSFNV